METKERTDTPSDFLQLLRESSAKTGVQGVSNIGGARSRARRTYWAVVVFAGVGTSIIIILQ